MNVAGITILSAILLLSLLIGGLSLRRDHFPRWSTSDGIAPAVHFWSG